MVTNKPHVQSNPVVMCCSLPLSPCFFGNLQLGKGSRSQGSLRPLLTVTYNVSIGMYIVSREMIHPGFRIAAFI